MKNVLINALPMTVVGTGIGRYLRGLSAASEAAGQDSLKVSYFVGDTVVSTPPASASPGWRERIGQLLWRMPWPVALGARLLSHAMTELRFDGACAGYDVYHEAGYFPFKTREPVRTVLTIHDLSLLRFPEWHPQERVRYWRRYFMDRLDAVDAFCAVSAFTAQEMADHLGISPHRITVTPLGYDRAVFNTEDDLDAQAFLEREGVPDSFLLFVGSGDPRKNLDLAAAALEASGLDLPLVTVGWSGWHRESRARTINLGYVSDRVLAQLYRRAQLLLMPSEYEGFGLPVLEAMACGCPVVTSAAGALREVGGEAATVVDNPRNTEVFGQIIAELAHDRARSEALTHAGLERANYYSWDVTFAKTVLAWTGKR